MYLCCLLLPQVPQFLLEEAIVADIGMLCLLSRDNKVAEQTHNKALISFPDFSSHFVARMKRTREGSGCCYMVDCIT